MSHHIYHASGAGPITVTPPVNQTWQIISGHVTLTSSATGGNRRLHFSAKTISDSDTVWDVHAGVNQTGSTVKEYHLRQGDNRDTAFVDDDVIVTIPNLAILQYGMNLTIADSAAIDEAADTYLVHFNYWKINSLNPRPEMFLR